MPIYIYPQTHISHVLYIVYIGLCIYPQTYISHVLYIVYVTNWGVCQGPISHNNEQTQTVEGII